MYRFISSDKSCFKRFIVVWLYFSLEESVFLFGFGTFLHGVSTSVDNGILLSMFSNRILLKMNRYDHPYLTEKNSYFYVVNSINPV